ncbi:hypothetical protein [Kitasatospora sp. NPDC058190]|uniref:hypothetical protein n=1 Tax=Kitasatospora sp. NPDC058190 TaxID=3346371 RepID=UPI0036DA06AC
MDIPAEAADSVALAAIVRGLVVTSARLVEWADPGPAPHGELLRGAYWYATRDGWPGPGADALSGRMLPAPERARRLLDHIGTALEDLADLDRVAAFIDRLATQGSGAHRQRAAHRAGGLPGVVDDLAGCMLLLERAAGAGQTRALGARTHPHGGQPGGAAAQDMPA